MKRVLYLLALPLLMAACEEEQPTAYVNDPGLYFFRNDYASAIYQRDSLSFTFYTKLVVEGGRFAQTLDVRTVGMPEARERSFTLRQANLGEAGAAVPGVHYVPFDDPEMVALMKVPAGATAHNVPVICINAPELAEKTVRLVVEIVENENFRQGVEAQSRFVVKFGDEVVPPNTWPGPLGQNWAVFFGTWSAEKMRFVSRSVGLFDYDLAMIGTDDPNDDFPLSTARMNYFKSEVKRLLAEYNAAHPGEPMLDENGNPIEFPA